MSVRRSFSPSFEFPCYYDVQTPASPRAALVALHGYSGNKDSMLKLAQQINDQDLTIISVQGPHQHMTAPDRNSRPTGYGFGWLTSFQPRNSIRLHHQLVAHVIDQHAAGLPVFLMGFSQSVALNFRYTFTYPNTVRGAIAICGGIPGDWDDGGYQHSATDVLYLHGTKDPIYPPDVIAGNVARLRQCCNTVESRAYDVGHRITRTMPAAINEWVLARIN